MGCISEALGGTVAVPRRNAVDMRGPHAPSANGGGCETRIRQMRDRKSPVDRRQLEKLALIGRQQTDMITRTPEAAKAFLIQAGIYTKAGSLKKNYGGGQNRKSGGK